jgi:hypothetical protein
MSLPPIEIVRTAFAQSAIATLGSQLQAYFRLVGHPLAQFSDLLDALDRGPVISDDAAARLRNRLQLPSGTALNVRRTFWEQMLKEHNIDPLSRLYEDGKHPAASPDSLVKP